MATSKTIYIKSKVLNYYGLAGFHYEYNKFITKSEDILIDGDIVHLGFTVLRLKGSIKNELITKQEYQEATGDYSCACDIDEHGKPTPPPLREIKNTTPTGVDFGSVIAMTPAMLIPLILIWVFFL